MRHKSEDFNQDTQQGHLDPVPIDAPGLRVDCPLPLQQHMAHHPAQQKLNSLRSFHMQSTLEVLNLQDWSECCMHPLICSLCRSARSRDCLQGLTHVKEKFQAHPTRRMNRCTAACAGHGYLRPLSLYAICPAAPAICTLVVSHSTGQVRELQCRDVRSTLLHSTTTPTSGS